MAIPEGWETVSLSDCGDGIRPAIKAGPFGSALKKSSYVKDGYRVYGQEQVIANDFSVGDYFVDDERFSALRACAVHPGDVLISLVGTFGRVAIVPRNASPGIINPRLVRIAPDVSRIDSGYLAVYIQSPIVQKVLVETAQGGTMGVLNATTLSKLSVTLPPLPEQKKIAAILSSVDDTIAKTESVIAELQIVKKAMMEQLLTKGMPGRHTRFKQTEIGEIPEEWEVLKISDIGLVHAGRQRNPDAPGSPRPYLRVANVFDGRIDVHDVLEMPFTDVEFRRFELHAGDVLLNEGQSLELVGRCSVYQGEYPGPCAFQNSLIRFRAGRNTTSPFAAQLFRWMQSSRAFAAVATQTTSIAHLGVSRFAGMMVRLPPLAEQVEIARVLDCFDSFTAQTRTELAALRRCKQALSSSLLSGEIRVIPEVA